MSDETHTPNVFEPVDVDLKDPAVAAVAAWLWPGAGHIYQRRYHKGILYMAYSRAKATLNIQNGGSVTSSYAYVAPQVPAGGGESGHAYVNIDGVGSHWRVLYSGPISIGIGGGSGGKRSGYFAGSTDPR